MTSIFSAGAERRLVVAGIVGIGDHAVGGFYGTADDELEVCLERGGIVAGAAKGNEVVDGDDFSKWGASPGDEERGSVEEVNLELSSEGDEGEILPDFCGRMVLVVLGNFNRLEIACASRVFVGGKFWRNVSPKKERAEMIIGRQKRRKVVKKIVGIDADAGSGRPDGACVKKDAHHLVRGSRRTEFVRSPRQELLSDKRTYYRCEGC
jgi:hypothetical protein